MAMSNIREQVISPISISSRNRGEAIIDGYFPERQSCHVG
jgi:hypothetical protein